MTTYAELRALAEEAELYFHDQHERVRARDAKTIAHRAAAHPAMAPWLAVITAAQAVIATDDEWILDIPDEDWDPKMLALRDAVKALEEPVSACGHCGEPSCGHRSSDLFAEEPSHA